MKTLCICTLLFFSLSVPIFAQSDECSCVELHNHIKELHDNFTMYIEEAPTSISHDLQSPIIIPSDSLEGKVFISFIINEQGEVICSKVERSTNSNLDLKALSVINKLKFEPAKQRGKGVISRLVLPVFLKK